MKSEIISRFYGLNRYEKGSKGEFVSMTGLSSDRYPCLAPERDLLLKYTVSGRVAAAVPQRYDENMKGITGVIYSGDGRGMTGRFIYNGSETEFEADTMSIPAGADITLVRFNEYILICAYKAAEGDEEEINRMYYYDTSKKAYNEVNADRTEGETERKVPVRDMRKNITAAMRAYGSGSPGSDAGVTNYLEITDKSAKWTGLFKEGDSVYISGFAASDTSESSNNTVDIDSRYDNSNAKRIQSANVTKVTDTKLYLDLRNYLGERLVFKTEPASSGSASSAAGVEGVRVEKPIPVLNHICVHNNRVWGTAPNGEMVYASKLGDCFNWFTYQGLANDSFYAQVGTQGPFVGIVSYRDNIVAFKRDYIHHIYGDKPSNFTMPKQLADCGCIDIKSAVQIGLSLYFLGYGGFYEYTGGQPELISQKLDRKYARAAGMSDGTRYIVCAEGEDGNAELLTYDPRFGTWHRDREAEAVGGFLYKNELYIVQEDRLAMYADNYDRAWQCVTVPITENTMDSKGMTELWIRARIYTGAYMDVAASEDGGDWIEHGRLEGDGTLRVYRLPVRFIGGEYYQIKLEGYGRFCVHEIERVFSVNGRRYRQ